MKKIVTILAITVLLIGQDAHGLIGELVDEAAGVVTGAVGTAGRVVTGTVDTVTGYPYGDYRYGYYGPGDYYGSNYGDYGYVEPYRQYIYEEW